MGTGLLGAVLTIVLVTFMLGVAVGGALCQREIGGFLRRAKERIWPPPAPPSGPALEQIARHARRLRAELLAPTPGAPMARRTGLSQAYDEMLTAACLALDVPDTLTGMPTGIERDAERLRVEEELTAAGLRLTA